MLLSVKPPLQNGIKSPHEYTHHAPTHSRYSPPDSPKTVPPYYDTPEGKMNNQHRGLPPPMGLSLPPPDRGLPAMASLGNLPAPPSQWTGQDESMRNWLQAKAEEDRRRAEEEKTRQEGLRLDQRKIEQSMLRESLQGGIPPVMVPLIFAGMGGAALSAQTLEWAQHYMAQLSLQNQQHLQAQQAHPPQIPPPPQPVSPDLRRDNRMLPPNPYGGHQALQPALPSNAAQPSPLPSQPAQSNLGRPSFVQSSGPRGVPAALSRINTGESQLQGPTSQPTGQPLHPLQQSHPAQVEPQQNAAPGLFFHHWTPTAAGSKNNQPSTPSTKSNQASPFSQSQQSHLRSDYQSSPKKRKGPSGQPVPAPPTTQASSDASPPFSSRSSGERDPSPGSRNKGRRHSRQQSDASSTREAEGRTLARPSSRQQRRDELGGVPGEGPKRQDTNSSVSTSGDESQTRLGTGISETSPVPYSTGTEMKEFAAKAELET